MFSLHRGALRVVSSAARSVAPRFSAAAFRFSSAADKNVTEAEYVDIPPKGDDSKLDIAEFERMLKSMNESGAAGAGPDDGMSFQERMAAAGLTSEDVTRMLDEQGLSSDQTFAPRAGDPSLHMPNEAAVAARADIASSSRTEEVISEAQEHSFQTETRQMLDIVTNSLYTDKEVFLRELISNASDALEKARYVQTQTAQPFCSPDLPMEIRIFPDDAARTITIQDTGIGMTKEELVSNLGTIARSGSKQFAKEARESGGQTGIIGQFGVGFYSGFMVGHKIEVFSKSARLNEDGSEAPGYHWVSDGTGKYTIAEARGVERGTKIIIHLRPDQRTYTKAKTVENVLKKYSNYVSFPIFINGVRLNVVQALWMMSKRDITDEMHDEFYRYHANAFDTPTYRMHFTTDAPIQINALFYFPERHMEKFGMGRMDPGTSLYSRKVLIKSKAQGLLPEYLRFVQGVVDSEDVPLNISRENMQDSLLITRISAVLTKRVIKFLHDEAVRDPARYATWYREFAQFIKEGVCSDYVHKAELARLLRFESSFGAKGESVSLDEYIARLPPTQTEIYYLCVPNRASAEASPYYESLRAAGTEVLFCYAQMDEFVMKNLKTYAKRKLVSCEEATQTPAADASQTAEQRAAKEAEHQTLVAYVKKVLGPKVSSVLVSTRLVQSPAVVVDHDSAAMRNMMRMVDSSLLENQTAQKLKLEINPNHPIFRKVVAARESNPLVANAVVEQVFDNALIAADILDNPRMMLPRIHALLEAALNAGTAQEAQVVDAAGAGAGGLADSMAAERAAEKAAKSPKTQAEMMDEFLKKASQVADEFEASRKDKPSA